VIDAVKVKYNLDKSINICCGTVRQRVKRNSNGGHIGQTFPMLEVEPYLVELFLKLAEMRSPITTSQGLQLVNSLINGVEEKKLSGKHELSERYWQSYMSRNNHLIRAKKAVKFDNKRAQWCNYLNMYEMYEVIYKNLCTNGLAIAHPEPLWRNEKGEVEEEEEKALGMKSMN
jgi:hypothetical protein